MRLIDADALMEVIRQHDYPLRSHCNSTDNGMFTLGIQQAVDNAPTIEAEPVVRCKDCEHGKSFTDAIGVISIHCSIFQTGMSQTGFCSMGKSAKGGAE